MRDQCLARKRTPCFGRLCSHRPHGMNCPPTHRSPRSTRSRHTPGATPLIVPRTGYTLGGAASIGEALGLTRMPVIHANGLDVNYEDTGGPGAPVVLIHGHSVDLRMWPAQLI